MDVMEAIFMSSGTNLIVRYNSNSDSVVIVWQQVGDLLQNSNGERVGR